MTKEKTIAFGSFAGFFAFGFGSGLARKAPGTFGTIAAIPFLFLLTQLPNLIHALTLLATFLFGVWVCQNTSKRLGVHDHGGIVWDEFVGLWATFYGLPLSWQNLILGFLLFRLFDITKPFPIKWLDQKVKGGFGIMIDDLIAAIFATLCLRLLQLI